MTTGPQHYTDAGVLVTQGQDWTDAIDAMPDELTVDQRIALRQTENAAAQVEAILALAAAIALKPGRYEQEKNQAEWARAAGADQ